jgi:hypothetical protein
VRGAAGRSGEGAGAPGGARWARSLALRRKRYASSGALWARSLAPPRNVVAAAWSAAPTRPSPAPSHASHAPRRTLAPPPELLARVPEDSLSRLQRLLNGPKSPLFSGDFQGAYARFSRATADARKGRPSTSDGGSGSRSSGNGGDTRKQRGFVGWSFDGLFGGARSRGDEGEWDVGPRQPAQFCAHAGRASRVAKGRHVRGPFIPSALNPSRTGRPRTPSSARLPADAPPPHGGGLAPPADPAGHYAALRLSVSAGPLSDDEIRAAYRKLVLELHPDKQGGKSARQQRQVRRARGARGRGGGRDRARARLH